jgi:integrase
MMRPKSTARDLPPRMLRRSKTLASGKIWESYYYNGRDADGKRREIPLGGDLNEAKRQWAELECKPAPVETGLMKVIFDRYIKEILPTKAPRTQKNNLLEMVSLRSVFDIAPVDAITPQHIAKYRDARKTKRRLRIDGSVRDPGGKPAPVAANREIALFSDIWNKAREWGYTAKENPVKGVRKNKETPRDFYADDEVWNAVRNQGDQALSDAMDLAYLCGQRPADVLKFRQSDVVDDALTVRQNKTKKPMRIRLTVDGVRTELGALIDRIRSRKITSVSLLATDKGNALSKGMLRTRFEHARELAALKSAALGNSDIAQKIRAFQFRDARAKAASEIEDINKASELLGHTKIEMTSHVYRRVGEMVNPTK